MAVAVAVLVIADSCDGVMDSPGARGMVARTDHPDDLRSRLVTLLPEGRTRVDAAMRQLVSAEEELIRGLDRSQVATIVEALRTIATVSSKASPRPGARRPR